MTAPTLTLTLDDSLHDLLPRTYRREKEIAYPLTRRASIKDIIEALHIPHTEVRSIFLKSAEVTFQHIPKGGERLALYSFSPGTDVTRPTVLRPEPLPEAVFMVDINVGKLARLLRMSGIDTWYEPGLNEFELAEQAAKNKRILLSRNHDLLQRKIITWGHLVRTEQPEKQLAEVITLFNLVHGIKPFSRCLECNTLLQPVEKASILHRLKSLTRKYYQRFHICSVCDQIYWQGSHSLHMSSTMQQIQLKLNRNNTLAPASAPPTLSNET